MADAWDAGLRGAGTQALGLDLPDAFMGKWRGIFCGGLPAHANDSTLLNFPIKAYCLKALKSLNPSRSFKTMPLAAGLHHGDFYPPDIAVMFKPGGSLMGVHPLKGRHAGGLRLVPFLSIVSAWRDLEAMMASCLLFVRRLNAGF